MSNLSPATVFAVMIGLNLLAALLLLAALILLREQVADEEVER